MKTTMKPKENAQKSKTNKHRQKIMLPSSKEVGQYIYKNYEF